MAHRLLGARVVEPEWNPAVTLTYAASESPAGEPILMLNGEGPAAGPVNSVVVMSDASDAYAPRGQHLVSVAVAHGATREDAALDEACRAQLGEWFGRAVSSWRLLDTSRIAHALPRHPAGGAPWRRGVTIEPGLYQCGDHVDNPSIDGALKSGLRAAVAAAADLAAGRC